MKPTVTTISAKVTQRAVSSPAAPVDALRATSAASPPASGASRSMAELIDQLSRFDGPPQQFLSHLLAGQCEIGRASRGAILRQSEGGAMDVLAVSPKFDVTKPPAWLKQAMSHASRVCEQALTLTTPAQSSDAVYEEKASRYLVMVPLLGDGGVRGAEAFLINSDDVAYVNECSGRIELTVSLINLYEMRLTVERSKSNLGRLGKVVEVTAAVNEHERLESAGMALCNQIAAQWSADRVSLGFLHNRSMCLCAMSHSNQFSRKMKMVQAIESSMEECIDQDLEVLYPAAAEASYVCRASSELSSRYGPTIVLNLPLRHQSEPIAVVTVERPWDKPFDLKEIETLRLLCDISTSRLRELYLHDRWFGAKIASAMREGLALAIGAKHTWMKLAAVLVLGMTVFLTFAHGEYRVEATFALEAQERRIVPAPFTAYLATVNAEAGDEVVGGQTVLATLNTTQLRLRYSEARAQRRSYLALAGGARNDGNTVEEQVNNAEAAKLLAEMERLEDEIARAKIVAPIDGSVLVGDLHKRVGGSVQIGEVLYEVAPLDAMQASLWVAEDRIADVRVGQKGELASASHPGEYVPFTVEQIHPVPQVVGQVNAFRVQVRLLETRDWMRPGMEGIAKIDGGRERLAWIWSRGLVNWLRMKLWM